MRVCYVHWYRAARGFSFFSPLLPGKTDLNTRSLAWCNSTVQNGVRRLQALAQATGRQESQIKQELAKEGDLGKVAAAARATQRTMFKPKALTLRDVFRCFSPVNTAALCRNLGLCSS